VLGPLVVACVVTDDPEALLELGARDSKELSAARREALAGPIRSAARGVSLEILEPPFIDRARASQSLNAIEAEAFARAAGAAAQAAHATALDSLQADAADAVEANFEAMLRRALSKAAPRLAVARFEVKHKGDALFPAVSAASVLAKVERDRAVAALARKVGADIGSGYPSDETTMRFLRDYITAHRDLPPFARRSWEPARELMKQAGLRDRTLSDFAKKEDER
jgi:ribonuclease HII